jgi:hypothetical protein
MRTSLYLCLTAVALTGCRMRQNSVKIKIDETLDRARISAPSPFKEGPEPQVQDESSTGGSTEGATNKSDTPAASPIVQSAQDAEAKPVTPSDPKEPMGDDRLTGDFGPLTTAEDSESTEASGGPVAGIEVWQNGSQSTTVTTGTLVQFRPTAWTRDSAATSGCDMNRGIIQASWTIGTRIPADIQRFAGQDCRTFDYAGTFTKAGNVSIRLDVLTAEGLQTHAETVIKVIASGSSSAP